MKFNLPKKYNFIITLLILIINLQLSLCQWPDVKKVKKAHSLPSLEVKIHPPDEFQPKVQAEVKKLEELREKNEREWMKGLETAYNDELVAAAKKINTLIKDALNVFDDNNLLMKSVEYAINPPTLVISKQQQNSLSPSFREMASFPMTDIQKRTMKALVADDNGVEKLRNPKVVITMDKVPTPTPAAVMIPSPAYTNTNKDEKSVKSSDNKDEKSVKSSDNKEKQEFRFQANNNIKDAAASKSENGDLKNTAPQLELANGAVANGALPEDSSYLNGSQFNFMSLLETKSNFGNGAGSILEDSAKTSTLTSTWTSTQTKSMAAKYTKPISVLMKMPSDPDASIQKEMDGMEKKRDGFEKKIFEKAKKEFKLITEVSTKELQVNLQHELVPFFVVSKNDLSGIKNIVKTNFEKEAGPARRGARDTPSFIQIDHDEINKKFPYVDYIKNSTNLINQINFNKYTYEKVLGLFADSPLDNESHELANLQFPNRHTASSEDREFKYGNELKKKIKANLRGTGVDRVRDTATESTTEENSKYKSSAAALKKKSVTVTAKEMRQVANNKGKEEKKERPKVNKLPAEEEVDFDKDACNQLAAKFVNLHLNCSESSNDFESLKNDYKSSFLETNAKLSELDAFKANIKTESGSESMEGDDDFINVKFSAADDPYPTIEKLAAQMETRRDLAEKFERLKILEFETHLQKAENEMIQDVLHEKLYKVMAKFGPAIEGIKERM